jgi:hypothetical protein
VTCSDCSVHSGRTVGRASRRQRPSLAATVVQGARRSTMNRRGGFPRRAAPSGRTAFPRREQRQHPMRKGPSEFPRYSEYAKHGHLPIRIQARLRAQRSTSECDSKCAASQQRGSQGIDRSPAKTTTCIVLAVSTAPTEALRMAETAGRLNGREPLLLTSGRFRLIPPIGSQTTPAILSTPKTRQPIGPREPTLLSTPARLVPQPQRPRHLT